MHVSGAAGITNNGISLIPTFSLSKPAALFNMSIGKSKFSFDTEFTFSLEGKPWYFLFWLRYKLINTEKFRLTAGTHLGLNFKNKVMQVDDDSTSIMITERYWVGELSPNYSITKNISAGVYYLHAKGLDPGTNDAMNFITLNASVSNIKLTNKLFVKIVPQLYYLKIDNTDGFYFTSACTFTKNDFPLSLSSIVNKVIQTHISASKDFTWNVTLIYSFHKRYVAQ